MSKFIDLNPKNEIFNNYQQQTADIIDRAAERLYKDKAYKDEYKAVFVLSSVLKFACSLVSFSTMLICVYFAFSALFGFGGAFTIALIFCTVFEAIKAQIWSICTKYYLKYKTVRKLLVSCLVGIHFLSLVFSCVGAYQIPKLLNENTATVLPSQATSTTSSQIAELDKQLQVLSGSLVSSTNRKAYLSLTNQKNKLIEQQEQERKTAQEQQKKADQLRELAAQEQEKAIQQEQIIFVSTSALLELVFIFCSLFLAYYLFRTHIDNSSTGTADQDQEQRQTSNNSDIIQQTSTNGHQAPAATANVNKIGFKQGLEQGQQTSKELEYTRICRYSECQKPFIHSIHNQKFCCDSCRKKHHELKKVHI